MRSTFFGLEMGRRALSAQQRALDVTGHNIANANTAGYTRQEAVLRATMPYTVPAFNCPVAAGQLGTGVEVGQIRRIQDSYINTQIRSENRAAGDWEARNNTLEKLEVIFNEPSEAGLKTVMDQFWEGLQFLSQKANDPSVRDVVIERGIALAESFNHLDRMLTDLQSDLTQAIALEVQEIDNMSAQIADLNRQIVVLESAGNEANDLRDKRDLLIDELSRLVDVTVTEDPTGYVTVSVGGQDIVDNTTVTSLDQSWVNGGKLYGMLYSRDTIVPDYLNRLDQMADSFITEFNSIHSAGFGLDGSTGNDFFVGTTAGTIAVSAAIQNDSNLIAAAKAAADLPGDNTNALDLAGLKHHSFGAPINGTLDDYYGGIVAQLGIEAQSAQRMVDNRELLLAQLKIQKQSVSGVSLDEEMTNMIKFQHAYNAAARMTTTMDELLDVIINRMGLAGR